MTEEYKKESDNFEEYEVRIDLKQTPHGFYQELREKRKVEYPLWVELDINYLREVITYLKEDQKELLLQLFESAKNRILSLPQDWDDNEAETFTLEVVNKTIFLLNDIFSNLLKENFEVPIPLIQPVPGGSIDINWETDKFELLVNIPKDDMELVNLYGEHLAHPEDELDLRCNYKIVRSVLINWLKTIL